MRERPISILDDMARMSHDLATASPVADHTTARTVKSCGAFPPDGFPIAVDRRGPQGALGTQPRNSSAVVIVTGGRGVHVVGDESRPLAAGDVFVAGVGRFHEYRDVDSLRVVNVLFDPERLRMDVKDLPDSAGYRALFAIEEAWRRRPHVGGRVRLSPKQLEAVVGLVDRLEHELRARDVGFGFLATALFMQLIGDLSRYYGRPAQPDVRSRIAEAVAHLETQYDSEIDLDQLAGIAHMSKRHFLRAFRAAVGKSPIAYLIERRVDRAAALLRHGGANVTEVAFRVGFNDSNYFSRQFRKVMGVSPREYQKEQGGMACLGGCPERSPQPPGLEKRPASRLAGCPEGCLQARRADSR
jgi:AraC-like DNA-binding protein/mannose-6-phosphate isomerase-like protein (cupin superfamily)